jgi:hypothetical protein
MSLCLSVGKAFEQNQERLPESYFLKKHEGHKGTVHIKKLK